MKHILLSLLLVTSITMIAEPQLGKASIEDIVNAMTIEEKVELIVGSAGSADNQNATIGGSAKLIPGAAGSTNSISRFGIPEIVLADGPAGLRIDATREGSNSTYYCTHFPIETLLASSWDIQLVESVGKAMGNEVKEYGVDVLLAPATNIHRNPLNGRNFEYYSEDPLLSGKICAAMIRGVQSNGVGTSLKHFAFNNQESNRTGNDARMSERTAREIYLKPFEIAVKESQPWTIMTSYNKLNGTYTSERADLLKTVLRDEWGFKGLVMTDWYGGRHPELQMNAGNDLLMPGTVKQKDVILNAIRKGTISLRAIDENVTRILGLIVRTPRFLNYKYSDAPDLQSHAAVTRSSATEGMILLKNDNNSLPLDRKLKKVAVFGRTSYDFMAGGTGSGDVNHKYVVSLTEGLANAGFVVDKKLEKEYLKYLSIEKPKLPKFDWWHPRVLVQEKTVSTEEIAKLAKTQDVAIITIGRTSGEFIDRSIEGDFNLSEREINMIKDVSNIFHSKGKKVVVILNISGVIETQSWKDLPDAILLAWMPGQEGGNSVADILIGKENPSGKLPMTFPCSYNDIPSSADFPDCKDITEEMILNSLNLREMEVTETNIKNFDYTEYSEGIMVGYRYYGTNKVKVSYPFGFGLSYTRFDISDYAVNVVDGKINISLKVRNAGEIAGKEVVQVYVTAPGKTMVKPIKELKSFAKTNLLQPGQAQTINMTINVNELATYDEQRISWVVEAGNYQINLGTSSETICATKSITIANEIIAEKTHGLLK
ncbi:MAG: glycoside hydrolase family 3 C-terminal domain-containing protein [Muribaculaceae bacterium]|nr:glycoside hydrolase family 3 C-terminal domain-containing protein [Muribaculaceae bacterium]